MAKFVMVEPTEAPKNDTSSKADREMREAYQAAIRDTIAAGKVGQVTIDEGETQRSIKVRLRHAATVIKAEIDVWDVNNIVYFKKHEAKAQTQAALPTPGQGVGEANSAQHVANEAPKQPVAASTGR